MDERHAHAKWRPLVLVRPSRLRVCRSWTRLAGSAFHWITAMAVPRRANRNTGDKAKRQLQVARSVVSAHYCRHCTLLQPGTFLGYEIASYGCRVLALVGCASVGRRILRSFCDSCYRISIR